MYGLSTIQKLNEESARDYGKRMDARIAKAEAEKAEKKATVKVILIAMGFVLLTILAFNVV